jgi:hypothetical protein
MPRKHKISDVDARSPRRQERFAEPERSEHDDDESLSEGRNFYGYNLSDYRDYEGREPEPDDYGGRGPDWDDDEPGWQDRGRSGLGYQGSDIRGYEGREYVGYGGGYEGYYGDEERLGPSEYERWRWGLRQDDEPVGQWSSRHSHDFQRFGRRRWRGGARARGVARAGEPHTQPPRQQRVGVPRQAMPDAGFRGVPPKGYTRSDSAIFDELCELIEDADVDPSNVTVSVEDREVVLSGTVDDRWAKRYVEDLAYSVRGVNDVINKLRIEQQVGGKLTAPESRSREDVPDPDPA